MLQVLLECNLNEDVDKIEVYAFCDNYICSDLLNVVDFLCGKKFDNLAYENTNLYLIPHSGIFFIPLLIDDHNFSNEPTAVVKLVFRFDLKNSLQRFLQFILEQCPRIV